MNTRQRGVALIIVLFIMVLMVIVAVRINERWQQLLLHSQYQQGQIESRWALAGAEALARHRLAEALQGRQQVALQQPWQKAASDLQLEGIEAQGLIRDRDSCFNLNALSQAKWPTENESMTEDQLQNSFSSVPGSSNRSSQRSEKKNADQLAGAVATFNQLIINSGYEPERAMSITQSVLNWFGTQMPMTSQQQSNVGSLGNRMGSGRENQAAGTASRLMVDISQLREIKEIDQPLYLSLSKQVCVHRDNLLAVNINTLTEQQAPLLAALLSGQLSVAQAKNILQHSPAGGWGNVDDFLRSNGITSARNGQPLRLTTESHYFELMIWVKQSEQIYLLRTLLLRKKEKWFALQRRYGWGE